MSSIDIHVIQPNAAASEARSRAALDLDAAQDARRRLLEAALERHGHPEQALQLAIAMAERLSALPAASARPMTGAGARRRGLRMSQSHVRWTAERDEAVQRLWQEGLSVVQIAARLGRTPASINGRVGVLGLPKRRRWRKAAGGPNGGA